MSKLQSGLGGNNGAVLAGGGMVIVLLLLAYIGFGRQDVAAVPVSATAERADPAATLNEAQPDAPVVGSNAPSFDTLRRETDGTTIIAGRAAPLSDVKILVDGAEVATATADTTGVFAAMTSLPPKGDAQIVSLSAQTGEEVTNSVDEIILAPSVSPQAAEPAVEISTLPVTTALEEGPVEQSVETTVQTETAQVVTPTPEILNDTIQPTEAAPEQTEALTDPGDDTPRVAVLKSDAEGVTLLNPVVPSAMESVALDTIGYSDLGEVQLTGRAQADTASVRVYLDNRSVVSLPVGADGRWRGDLPDVDEGVYTLRVDEVSAQGVVSSRVETPFKRESAQVLAQAAENADGPIKSITVQAGATLWAIARDRYGDGTLYVQVVEANSASIRNPDLIYPGQVFDLPN